MSGGGVSAGIPASAKTQKSGVGIRPHRTVRDSVAPIRDPVGLQAWVLKYKGNSKGLNDALRVHRKVFYDRLWAPEPVEIYWSAIAP